MNRNALSTLLLTIFVAVAANFGCQTTDQKEQESKAIADRMALDQARQDSISNAQRRVTDEEWQAFVTETKAKIKANDSGIEKLKADMKKSGKKMDEAYTKSIETLEQKNKTLEAKLDSGYEKGQKEWAEFKREFNHDMDELGQALNDLVTNNKN